MRVFQARYPGKCVCGCQGSFAPGDKITGSRQNYKLVSHVSKPVYEILEEQIARSYHDAVYSWGQLATWASQIGAQDLQALCETMRETMQDL